MDKRPPKNQSKDKNDCAQLKQTISELKSQNRKLRKEAKILKKQANQLRKVITKVDLQEFYDSEEYEIVPDNVPDVAEAMYVCVKCGEDAIEEITLPMGGMAKHIKICGNCGYRKTTTK